MNVGCVKGNDKMNVKAAINRNLELEKCDAEITWRTLRELLYAMQSPAQEETSPTEKFWPKTKRLLHCKHGSFLEEYPCGYCKPIAITEIPTTSEIDKICTCLQHHKVHAVNCPNYAGESLAEKIKYRCMVHLSREITDKLSFHNIYEFMAHEAETYFKDRIEQVRVESYRAGLNDRSGGKFNEELTREYNKGIYDAENDIKEKFIKYHECFPKMYTDSMIDELFGTEGKG